MGDELGYCTGFRVQGLGITVWGFSLKGPYRGFI